MQVVDAVIAEVGGDRVGIRISPFGGFLDADDDHPYALHVYLLEELNKRDLAYVHFIEPRDPSSKGVGSPLAVHDWQHKEHNLDVSTPKALHGISGSVCTLFLAAQHFS